MNHTADQILALNCREPGSAGVEEPGAGGEQEPCVQRHVLIQFPCTYYPFNLTRGIPRSIMASMKEIRFTPIGLVHSPFGALGEAPRQARFSQDTEGSVTLFPEYADGLRDLEGFSHIILLCYLHLTTSYSLDVRPGWDGNRHGLFATRTPRRPNPIGMSVVRLTDIKGNMIHIRGIDMVDGTPLLDIKPYVPHLDEGEQPRFGWMEHVRHSPFGTP